MMMMMVFQEEPHGDVHTDNFWGMQSLTDDQFTAVRPGAPLLDPVPAPRPYRGKRLFDIIFALLALALATPVIFMIAVAIKVTSPGPVIYRSSRLGRNGQLFSAYKFRTMFVDADKQLDVLLRTNVRLSAEYQETVKLRNDPRVTPLGRFLRVTSLDEIPQFVNVLRGDMSVVGPRPPLPLEVEMYGAALPVVLSVRPGITGPWQVSCRRSLAFESRIEGAREYLGTMSFLTDVKLIIRTLAVMVFPDASRAC